MKIWKITQLINQLNHTNALAIDLTRLFDHIERGFSLFVYLGHCGVDVSFLNDMDRAELKAEWKALGIDDYRGPDPDGGASFLVELLIQGLGHRVGDYDVVSTVARVDEAVNAEVKRQLCLDDLCQTHRAKCWWNPVYGLLRDGLWHVTSPDGFRGIRNDGLIDRKNGKSSWDVSKNSYGFKRGYNSLFDFEVSAHQNQS